MDPQEDATDVSIGRVPNRRSSTASNRAPRGARR